MGRIRHLGASHGRCPTVRPRHGCSRDNERIRLEMVRRRPMPWPPEPLRWLGIQMTRRSIARADADGGRRDLWLRTLDRLGLGFDS